MRLGLGLIVMFAVATSSAWAQSPDIILGRIIGNSKVKEAQEHIRSENGASATGLLVNGVEDDFHNRISIRAGSQTDSFVAVVYSVDVQQSLDAASTILRTLDAASIVTKKSIVFVGVQGDESTSSDALRSFLEKGAQHGKIVSCFFIEAAAEGTVFGPPNSIGSTTVQYGLQSTGLYFPEPDYKPAFGPMTVPIELRIPTVGAGVGDSKATVKGIQSAMTALLAIAGV